MSDVEINVTVDSATAICAEHIDEITNVSTLLPTASAVLEYTEQLTTVATNISNVNAVGTDISNVNAVAADLTNIDAVNANKTNINTVAGNITNVNTVAGISSNVTTVAGISSDVTAVKNNATDISAVADNITNVNKVADNETNINAVASNETNINAVNSNKTNINTVAGISSSVTTVAGISSAVTAVNSNATNINTVASNISNVNAVGGNIAKVTAVANNETNINAVNNNKTNIDAVAGNATNINAVNANKTNINAVAGNATNINAVNANKTNIDTCATNITSLIDAPSYATQAGTYASNAAASAGTATAQATIATQQAALAKQYAEEAHGESDVMVSNLRASRAYKNYEYEQYDAEGLADVKSYAHSTYDSTKFTKVGSPTITDDGIASGFSSGHLEKGLEISANSNYTIKGKINIETVNSLEVITNLLGANNTLILSLRKDSTNSRVLLVYKTSNSNGIINTSDNSITAGGTYDYEINVNGSNLTFKFNGVSYHTVTDFENIAVVLLTFGSNLNGTFTFNGSIDLKQFKITVNGVPVFSGNKTGIDTIKADDYTVVGSPTISADGVASGFSASKYISKSLSIAASSNYTIKGSFTTGTLNSYQILFALNNSTTQKIALMVNNADNTLAVYFKVSGSPTARTIDYTNILLANTKYNYEVSITGTNLVIKLNNTIVKSISGIDNEATTDLFIGAANSGGSPFTGAIDLNGFKVYVNGDLVYQPCLKIPYTLSKTGSKIVDSVYRNRVTDMYEQFGWANYFTLQEGEKDNYTKVGSPTISSDGIASGFSNNNYLNCGGFGTTPQTSWSRSVRFKTPASFSSLNIIDGVGDGTYNTAAYIEITSSGELRAEFHKSSLNAYPNAGVVPVSTWYDAEYGQYIENGSVISYLKYKKDDDADYTTKTSTVITNLIPTSTSTVTIGLYGNASNVYMNGYVDLNYSKAYVDNKLTYQAIIPSNFMLPQGENLDGHVTTVDWYRNGANSWEYDTNLDCEQTGSCTSGTDVTFGKPFADTNYSLSVPYSAKTKTGFTPSQTGDFIAKGKITLG